MSHPSAITSLQNPRIKNAVRLRDSRGRQKQDRIVIDGLRELSRALDAGLPLTEIFFDPGHCSPEALALVEAGQAAGGEPVAVAPHVFEKLAFGARSEGLVAVAPTPRRDLASLSLPERPLVAVLEGLEKPGNVGAVLRTADAAGLDAVLVADAGTDLFNPNTIRASLGTVFSLPVAAASAAEVLAWLREHKFRILAARVDGAIDYRHADYTSPAAIVLGSEAAGLSPLWQGDDVTPLQLPMRGHADSLNVAATAAILFYEATRATM